MGGTRLTGDDAWFVGKFRIIPIWGVVRFSRLGFLTLRQKHLELGSHRNQLRQRGSYEEIPD